MSYLLLILDKRFKLISTEQTITLEVNTIESII